MKNIKKIVLGNKINSKIFSLGREVYIVGGYLRDILIGKESKDIDCIVRGDIREFAAQLIVQKKLNNSTIVELKKEQMIRIVLQNRLTLDFTELKSGIRDNLAERDFTMDAIAWSPETGLIDPFNGIKDIAKHRIKAISINNFRHDPLRLLRAYRFVSELGWKAEPETRKMVRHLKKEIRKSAAERITLEFFKLLNFKNFHNALKMASDDRLLECFLSIPHKRLLENIKTIPSLESQIKKLPSKFKRNIEKPFSQELTYKGLLRLEQLLTGLTLSRNRLRLSRIIFERLKIVHELLSKSKKQDIFSQENLFNTFFKAKDAAFDLLILSGNIKLLSQTERFKKIWERSLLTSEEIMDATGLKGGVKLGKLIYGLKKMQFEGKLKTKKEADKAAQSHPMLS
ncbi:MAG: hypothetical protein NTW44_03315 [Nitrospirae bacterium]|nr:hypothetical protein [Nitrospirota bacterium]